MVEKRQVSRNPVEIERLRQTRPAATELNIQSLTQITLLETILDNVPEAMIVTDGSGRILRMNQASRDLLGSSFIQAVPDDWTQVFGYYAEDGRVHFLADQLPLLRALKGENVEAAEMIMQPGEDAQPVWISMSARPFYSQADEIAGAVVLFRDITYRKKIEQARELHSRHTEMLYQFSRAMAESSSDLNTIIQVFAVHAAENIGDASIVTLESPTVSGKVITAYYHPEVGERDLLSKHMPRFEQALLQGSIDGILQPGGPKLIQTMEPQQLAEMVAPQLAGFVTEAAAHGLLVVPMIASGRILGSLGLFRDRASEPYTLEDQSMLSDMASRAALAIENSLLLESLREQIRERNSAKEALQTSEERFRSIFETTTLGIKVLDAEGVLLQTNPAFRSMLGVPEAELIGRHFHAFVHPTDAPRIVRRFQDLLSGNTAEIRLEHRILHQQGATIWVKTTFTTMGNAAGENSPAFIVGIIENITEQKKLEREMAELKNRLQGSVEMERLHLAQELHDGPMQDLYSSIFLLDDVSRQVAAEYRTMLGEIRLELHKVLDDLRATARELRPPTLSEFGLEKAIRSYMEDFQEKHPEFKVQVTLEPDSKQLPDGVRLALFRILQHSLSNILRHANANRVRVNFSLADATATLEIIDNGVGFELPTSWMELVRQGHFGMAGAAERIEALGGTFTVESSPGGGATVRARIPCGETQGE